MKHNWLDSGSLFILMPYDVMAVWRGTDSDDYKRACGVANEWLVPLAVGAEIGLLLGGDPGMAIFVTDRHGDLTLVRWVYANDEEDLIEFALGRESVQRTGPDITVVNSQSRWVLFDSASNPLVDQPAILEADLPLGPLLIDTALLKGERNSAIVHRFLRTKDA